MEGYVRSAASMVKYYDNYLSGFSDVVSPRSFKQFGMGILKILSYIIVPIPLNAIALRNKYQKIVQLYNRLDAEIENKPLELAAFRVNDVYVHRIAGAQRAQIDADHITSDELIEYLIEKIQNYDGAHPEEKIRFQKGFRSLSFNAQEVFFKKIMALDLVETAYQEQNVVKRPLIGPGSEVVSSSLQDRSLKGVLENNLLKKMIVNDLIPRDIKELNFTLGDLHYHKLSERFSVTPMRDPFFQMNRENAMLMLNKLRDFPELVNLRLNLVGLGCFSPGVESGLMSEINDFEVIDGMINNIDCSNSALVTRAIRILREEVQRDREDDQPPLDYDIFLGNVRYVKENNGDGRQAKIKWGLPGEENYLAALDGYLNKE